MGLDTRTPGSRSPERDARIIAARANGATVQQIAEREGMDRNRINQILRVAFFQQQVQAGILGAGQTS